jgi:hypothetical protein
LSSEKIAFPEDTSDGENKSDFYFNNIQNYLRSGLKQVFKTKNEIA